VHIHDGFEHDAKCDICIIVNNFQDIDTPSYGLDIVELKPLLFYVTIYKIENITFLNKANYSTAPPIC